MTVEEFLESLVSCLRGFDFCFVRESKLHEGVGLVLKKETPAYLMWETALSAKDRPDFWFPDEGVAVELKTQGSLSALTRQVHRYACLEAVRGVLVVTPLRRLCALPGAMSGVPVRVAYLEGSVF